MYNVIIIEDDPVIISLNTSFLNACKDFRLTGCFRSCDSAIKHLIKNPTDLILLDIHLPGMNGLEFMEYIRQNKINTQVIILTMDNDASFFRTLNSYGILDYLIKPYTRERFESALNSFTARARILHSADYLSQEVLDSLQYKNHVAASLAPTAFRGVILQKGIQQDTCKRFLSYLEANADNSLTIDEIVKGMSLSRVTIRRYMSYLTEAGYVTMAINYSTGGRPSMIYKWISKSAECEEY
jgi:response regulator of citrate/malate metabolism